MGTQDEGPVEAARPLLRIVRGTPDDYELAALVAVLAARSGGAAPEPEPALPAWNDRASGLRRPLPHGPGAWRASAWPS
ncbi:MAG: acyl-CoA carboxylase subunit epsilon [Sporichthyaceae bacterium]